MSNNPTFLQQLPPTATIGAADLLWISTSVGGGNYVDKNITGTNLFASLPTTSLTNSHIYVGNVSNVPADVAMAGDITINNSGVTAIGSAKVTNAMVATGIDAAKLANGSVSNTEFQFLDGVTSSIQTQLNAKAPSGLASAHIFVGSAGGVATDVAVSGNISLSNTGAMTVASLGAISGASLTNLTAGNISAGTAGINISGNAATVTTNANLTGAVTSSGNATSLGSFTSSQLAGALTDETGSGSAVFATSPTLVTPALGTPSALVGTNITGTGSNFTSGTTNALKSATTTVSVSSATAPTSGQVLTATSGTAANWQTPPGNGLVAGTAAPTTSGTSIDFTSLPSTIKTIQIGFNGVSTNGSSVVIVQLRASGAAVTSGYLGAASGGGGTVSSFTTGCAVSASNSTADTRNGIITFVNISGNIWVASGAIVLGNAALVSPTGTTITLSAVLDGIRITTVNGTDTFDAGSVNIFYQ